MRRLFRKGPCSGSLRCAPPPSRVQGRTLCGDHKLPRGMRRGRPSRTVPCCSARNAFARFRSSASLTTVGDPRVGPVAGADLVRGVDVGFKLRIDSIDPNKFRQRAVRCRRRRCRRRWSGALHGGRTGNCSMPSADPTAQIDRQPAAITASAVSMPSAMPRERIDMLICRSSMA